MTTDLWRFAESLYQRPGVEAACLHLQDEGADVCLLLCAAWLERRAIPCTPARTTVLREIAQPWQRDVVVPLRQIRQRWRTPAQQDNVLAALREQIKRLELEAEREQLQRMATASIGWPEETVGTSANWLNTLAPTLTERGHDALQQLRTVALAHSP